MSIKLQSLAWDLALPTNEKIVLVLMCDFAGDDGLSCFPSRETIARKYGSSKRTIQRLVANLETRGLLIPIKNQKGGSSRQNEGYTVHYAINVEMLKAGHVSHPEAQSKGDNLSPLEEGKGDTSVAPRVTNATTKGDTSVIQSTIEPPIDPPESVSALLDSHAPPSPPKKDLQGRTSLLPNFSPPLVKNPPVSKAPVKTVLPPDFAPPDDWRDYAGKKGLAASEAGEEWVKFRDHHHSNATRFADWDAAWRNWIRRTTEYREQRRRIETSRGRP